MFVNLSRTLKFMVLEICNLSMSLGGGLYETFLGRHGILEIIS